MDPGNSVIEKMRMEAFLASQNAYCPYSKFPVGAAVLGKSGEIFSGCNVENASYGLTICAERNAIFQAVARGPLIIDTLVIVTNANSPTYPCGACRQVINEFGPDTTIFCFSANGKMYQDTIGNLLPHSFGQSDIFL